MRKFCLPLLALALAACAGTSRADSKYPSLAVEDVAVYYDEAVLTSDFEVVEVIAPQSRSTYGQAADPTTQAVERAAYLGADVLLIVEADKAIGDSRIRAAASSRVGSYSRLTYYAIRTLSE